MTLHDAGQRALRQYIEAIERLTEEKKAIAADIAEQFQASPGGLFDAGVSEDYYSTILQRANTVPAEQAFREFRGRDPDPMALLRRFGLESIVGASLARD